MAEKLTLVASLTLLEPNEEVEEIGKAPAKPKRSATQILERPFATGFADEEKRPKQPACAMPADRPRINSETANRRRRTPTWVGRGSCPAQRFQGSARAFVGALPADKSLYRPFLVVNDGHFKAQKASPDPPAITIYIGVFLILLETRFLSHCPSTCLHYIVAFAFSILRRKIRLYA